MRLFTAVDPSEEVHQRLVRLLERLKPAALVRWTRAENLHLTLKFIGEFPEGALGRLEEVLRGVRWAGGFEVAVRGLGFFPNPRAPRVFWAGIEAGPELGRLAGEIDRAVVGLGVAAEQRPYSPHLTLARVPDRDPLVRLHRAIEALDSQEFGSFRPERFYLYRSRPGPGGSVYSRIGEFPTTF